MAWRSGLAPAPSTILFSDGRIGHGSIWLYQARFAHSALPACRIQHADDSGATALHAAARYGHAEALRALVAAGSRPCTRDGEGATALHLAAAAGCVDAVRALLEAGAAAGAADSQGQTPLHRAVLGWDGEERHAACVRALLAAGADPLAFNCRQVAALQMSLCQGAHSLV